MPDVAGAAVDVERDWGVRPSPGGSHPGRGTHNALVDLGDGTYLEIIGPDPRQPAPARPRPFGLDTLAGPRLVTWAARAPDIEAHAARSRARGFDPGPVGSMSRARPDGVRLEWKLTSPDELHGEGVVPFLIDWGTTPHPTTALPAGCRLTSLRAEHPRPGDVRAALAALDLELLIDPRPQVRLVATVETPRGIRVLS